MDILITLPIDVIISTLRSLDNPYQLNQILRKNSDLRRILDTNDRAKLWRGIMRRCFPLIDSIPDDIAKNSPTEELAWRKTALRTFNWFLNMRVVVTNDGEVIDEIEHIFDRYHTCEQFVASPDISREIRISNSHKKVQIEVSIGSIVNVSVDVPSFDDAFYDTRLVLDWGYEDRAGINEWFDANEEIELYEAEYIESVSVAYSYEYDGDEDGGYIDVTMRFSMRVVPGYMKTEDINNIIERRTFHDNLINQNRSHLQNMIGSMNDTLNSK